MRKERSWLCTFVVQVSLCIAMYLALNLGEPHNSVYVSSGSTRDVDIYFVSVRGGYRDIKQQIRLLKLMEEVAKVYKAKFVVNISELGEDDPLTKNASRLFSSMNVPWYTTRASKGLEIGCFSEQISITDGKSLTIAGMDTESLQDLMLAESKSGIGNHQLNWLTQRLKANANNWFIIVGYHPVVGCKLYEEHLKAKQVFEPLHNMFMKYGVNAYISRQGCKNHTLHDGVAYLGIANPVKSEPSSNESWAFQKETETEFLLHRVSSLQIETYFITLTGEVVKEVVVHQRGANAM